MSEDRAGAASTDGANVLLRGARLIDGTGSPSVAADLLLGGGRVAAIGPAGSLTAPMGALQVDLPGRTVIPGLIDLHVHSTFASDMRGYLAKGVTSIRFAGIGQAEFRRVRDAIAGGRIPGPRVFTLGPMLDTFPPSWPEWSHVVSSAEDARRTARHLLEEEGTDGLISVQQVAPDLLRPIVETAHDHGRPVMGQLWWTDGAEAAEIGIDQLDNTARIAASAAWSGDRLFAYRSIAERIAIFAHLWTSVDWPATERIMDAMREADVAYCPTIVTSEQQSGMHNEVVEDDPLYRELYGPEDHAAWEAFKSRVGGGWTPEEMQRWRDAIEPRMEWMRRYRERGGRILVATDMQFGGIAMHREMELLRQVGFSPLELISIATGGNARAARIDDRVGTLQAGKSADLVIVRGEPDRDLRALGAIEAVVLGGRVAAGALPAGPPEEQRG